MPAYIDELATRIGAVLGDRVRRYGALADEFAIEVAARDLLPVAQVLRDHPQLATMGRITILDSFRSVPLALWDEQASRLVSFRQARMARAG